MINARAPAPGTLKMGRMTGDRKRLQSRASPRAVNRPLHMKNGNSDGMTVPRHSSAAALPAPRHRCGKITIAAPRYMMQMMKKALADLPKNFVNSITALFNLYSFRAGFTHKYIIDCRVLPLIEQEQGMEINIIMRNGKKKNKADAAPRRTVRERVADSLDVSKEILLNSVKIVLIGSREVTIENYNGIVEYTDSSVVLDANPHKIKIGGSSLEVRTITREILYITGDITSLEFRKEA